MLHDHATTATAAERSNHLLHTGPIRCDIERRVADLAAIVASMHDPAFQALHVYVTLEEEERREGQKIRTGVYC